MADHTSPDYYKQVTLESQAAMARENQAITSQVEKLVESRFYALQRVLANQFGWASVRHADLTDIEDLISDVAAEAAERAKSIMVENRYQESRLSSGSMLQAVLAGVQLGEGSRG